MSKREMDFPISGKIQVKVVADNEKSQLKKGEVFTVYHIYWHIASAIENYDRLFFLIYNKKTKQFIYELSTNFAPYEK